MEGRKNCRHCGSRLDISVVDLGETPLANRLLAPDEIDLPEPKYPLHVKFCEACHLVQTDHDIPAQVLFGHYLYFSSYSTTWVEHARDFCRHAKEDFALNGASLVVEIASNDGYLLRYFVEMGIPCLGVEPAANVAEKARELGVPTRTSFFSAETAASIKESDGPADLIIANNVLAHVSDINDFVRGIAILLDADGVASIEVPHLLRLLNEVQFDTIYHEHFSYFSLLSLQHILAAGGLKIFDCAELSTHGGSLRISVCHANCGRATSERVEDVVAAECAAGLEKAGGYVGFADKVRAICDGLRTFIAESKSKCRLVAAYGAAAKGNTLLNVSGLTQQDIAFVCDKSPHKQGLALPGSKIPILPPSEIARRKPEDILILPWNLAVEIRDELAPATNWKARFLTAIPSLRIWE